MKKIFVLVANLFLCIFMLNAQNNVIDPELQKILNQKNDDYISINISLKTQMPTENLSSLYCKSDSKEVRREIVINELKKFSKQSQEDIMSIIKAEERSESVADITSHWIINSVSCKAKRDVVYQLSSHPDIALISHNSELSVIYDDIDENESSMRGETKNLTDNVTHVNADKVWDLGYTGKGVLVAIIDSGVNYNHVDLKDHLWDGGTQYPYHGYNFIAPGQSTIDNKSHGTHCAGTICGDGTSGLATGMAPDATLMCLKVSDPDINATTEQIISAIEFAVDNGADIISMSLGWYPSADLSATFRTVFSNVLEAGVVTSVAAGNSGNELSSYPVPNNVRTPGNCPPPWIHPDQQGNAGGTTSVISVGAVDYDNTVAALSSRGPSTWKYTSYNDYSYNPGIGLIRPDICAPGVSIKSLSNESNDGYAIKAGTSMAAPCVAGVMALMLEKNPELTPSDLCRIIETTAVKLSDKKNNNTGSGCIDALAAVQAVDFNTSGPYLNVYSFTNDFIPGTNLNLELTLINNGQGSTSGNTNVTITTDDKYVTIVDGNENFGVMAANATAAAKFVITIDKLVPDNHKVTFTVNATNGNHKRTFDIKANISNELLPPSISAQVAGNSIKLTWDETNNATSYNIYRDKIFLANTESTSYIDEGLEYSTLYSYIMTSKRGDLESEYSQILRVQTEDNSSTPAPSNVAANVNGNDVEITWSNGNNSKGSNIYRKDETSGEETQIATNISGVSYTDSNWNTLQDGAYQYGVANLYLQQGKIYEEGFESISTSTLYDANNSNWYYYNENGKYNWEIAESFSAGMVNNPVIFTPFMGNKAAFIKSYFNSPTYLTYLVTNPMDYTQYDGNSISLSFHYITPAWGTDVNTLKVMVSTSAHNDGWKEVWSSNKTNVSEWTKVELNLSDFIGKKFHIAFLNVAGYGYCTGLDEVAISGDGSKESRIEWSETIYKNPNTFVQDGLWNDAENWSKKQVPTANDFLIFINANATIESGDVEVNSMTINNGSLTLNEGVRLTVNNDLLNTNAEGLIINDGAQVFQSSDDVAATFIMNIINPDEWSNENINGWQFIASPVKNANIEDFIPESSDYDLYKYEGNNDLEWLNHKGGQFETTFQQGKGYLASYESETQAVFKGILNNEKTHEYTLSYVTGKDLANFHLLGNPFPFDMDWDNLQKEDIANGYAVVNADGGYEYATSGTIKAGDGFFVKAIHTKPTLTYNVAKQRSDNTERSINIIASSNSGKDNLIICINDEGQEGFNKLNNFNKSIANIYVASNDKRYGIYNCNEDVKEVNVDFETKEMGNYTLHIDSEGEFETITLVDNITGEKTDMLLNDYTFTASSQDIRNRFVVRFTKDDGLSTVNCDNNFVYQSDNELIINAIGTAQIIDIMGRIVYSNEVTGDDSRIDMSCFDKGAYIIRLINKECVKTAKVVY